MPIEKANFLRPESKFEKIRKDKEAKGWRFVEQEKLTQTKFSKEARFEKMPYQTEAEIKARYLEIVKRQDPSSEFEVELLLDENTAKLKKVREIATDEEYYDVLNNLTPGDKNYFVLVRRIKK